MRERFDEGRELARADVGRDRRLESGPDPGEPRQMAVRRYGGALGIRQYRVVHILAIEKRLSSYSVS